MQPVRERGKIWNFQSFLILATGSFSFLQSSYGMYGFNSIMEVSVMFANVVLPLRPVLKKIMSGVQVAISARICS